MSTRSLWIRSNGDVAVKLTQPNAFSNSIYVIRRAPGRMPVKKRAIWGYIFSGNSVSHITISQASISVASNKLPFQYVIVRFASHDNIGNIGLMSVGTVELCLLSIVTVESFVNGAVNGSSIIKSEFLALASPPADVSVVGDVNLSVNV